MHKQKKLHVIPEPVSVSLQHGYFLLTSNTIIKADADATRMLKHLFGCIV